MKLILVVLLVTAGSAIAQPPVIDSMLIDEAKGILSVHGDFGAAQGKVWCDSIELPVVSWSASLITATIPQKGRGNSGGVEISARGYRCDPRAITIWRCYFSSETKTAQGGGKPYEQTSNTYDFSWRYDFHSLFRGKQFARIISLRTMISPRNYTNSNYGNPYHTFDSNYFTNLEFNLQERSVRILTSTLLLDSGFFILGGHTASGNFPSQTDIIWMDFGTNSFPPPKAIALQFNPSIIAPLNGGTNLGTDNLALRWDTLKLMDSYHLQVSEDSIVNRAKMGKQSPQAMTFVVDTVVSSIDFTLLALEKNTKYYWRVAGRNSEGESRWSDVWNFTTGMNAAVGDASAPSLNLSIYPNPSAKESAITYTLPERGQVRLIVYDMTGRIISTLFDGVSEAGQHEYVFDASKLAAGSYIVGLVSGGDQVSRIMSVVK